MILHDKKVRNNRFVQLLTEESTRVAYIGDFPFSGGDVIKNMLFVPLFKFNLLSASKLTKKLNYNMNFFPAFCIFLDILTGE